MTKNPNLFWGMIASMWVGNLMLLIINLPLIGLWVRLLKVPYRLIFISDRHVLLHRHLLDQQHPSDVISSRSSAWLGYVLIKLGLEPAPCCSGSFSAS